MAFEAARPGFLILSGLPVISWLVVAAVIIAAIALLLRAMSGPRSRINPQDHPDEDDSDGWPGV